ncbi:MAG: hypothetical protein JWN86_271 [Planctomycetota bacterium]|nr:hypothetical protein [Planctomycetota bacterium]
MAHANFFLEPQTSGQRFPCNSAWIPGRSLRIVSPEGETDDARLVRCYLTSTEAMDVVYLDAVRSGWSDFVIVVDLVDPADEGHLGWHRTHVGSNRDERSKYQEALIYFRLMSRAGKYESLSRTSPGSPSAFALSRPAPDGKYLVLLKTRHTSLPFCRHIPVD